MIFYLVIDDLLGEKEKGLGTRTSLKKLDNSKKPINPIQLDRPCNLSWLSTCLDWN